MRQRKNTRPWIYYGWIIVGTSFVTMAFHQAARFSFSIFQVPLIQEFGWGRGALGGAYALMLGSYALFSPIMGNLFDKKGARAIMPWGSVLVGTGFALGYFISELWHVYIVPCLFVGIGMALSGFALHSAIMPQWFQKKRGFATGLTLSGSGDGNLAFHAAYRMVHRHERLAIDLPDFRPGRAVHRRPHHGVTAQKRARGSGPIHRRKISTSVRFTPKTKHKIAQPTFTQGISPSL